MFINPNSTDAPKIPLKAKIYLAAWIVALLFLFFIFTSTVLLIALVAGVVLFVTNIFFKLKKTGASRSDSLPIYNRTRKYKDDDIIDI